MNLLLGIGDFFAKNWMLILLVVLSIGLLVPSYLRQKKESTARNELHEKIKKGVKIITTAGVYGTVESIEHTTDGDVVTIITGNAKNPSTMTIHINAIGGIDNKSVVLDKDLPAETNKDVEEAEELETENDEKEEQTEEVETKETPKKSKSKKSK